MCHTTARGKGVTVTQMRQKLIQEEKKRRKNEKKGGGKNIHFLPSTACHNLSQDETKAARHPGYYGNYQVNSLVVLASVFTVIFTECKDTGSTVRHEAARQHV